MQGGSISMSIREKAKKYFVQGKYNCCQAVISAYCDEYGIDDSVIFAMTEGFGLGMGGLKETCGAVTGMFMAIGLHNSAADKSDPRKTKMQTYEDIRNAAKEFEKQCGSIYCRDLKANTDADGTQIVGCDRCVELAAEYVEKYIVESGKN